MNAAIVVPTAGTLLIAFGCLIAIGNQWATRWMKVELGVWGKWAANMVTPDSVRVAGIAFIVMGAVFIILTVARFVPNHS
jgi:hypothetical protein